MLYAFVFFPFVIKVRPAGSPGIVNIHRISTLIVNYDDGAVLGSTKQNVFRDQLDVTSQILEYMMFSKFCKQLKSK
jgi:hypothetical protein